MPHLILPALSLALALSSASANDNPSTESALELARSLQVPIATATVNAEYEHSEFWEANGPTLKEAWREFDAINKEVNRLFNNQSTGLSLSSSLMPELASTIESVFKEPTVSNENKVKSQFSEIGPPGKAQAYRTQLLSPDGLWALRNELDRATSISGIPLRRPNGMNRHGCIIDDAVDGAVSLPTLTAFVQDLIQRVGRPLGRALFPDSVGRLDDTDYFAFTIRYNAEEDMELKEHRDASVVTLNVNFNLPEEEYIGSSLYLLDEDEKDDAKKKYEVQFEPGTMLIHRGSVRHAALPIHEGTRHNLVIWLFGEDGRVRVSPYEEDERLSVKERWEIAESTEANNTDENWMNSYMEL